MFEISLAMDERYRKWFHSPQQKLSRMLAGAVGFEVTLKLLNRAITPSMQLGILHGKPNVFMGVIITAPTGREWPMFGAALSCGSSEFVILGSKVYSNIAKCERCIAETTLAQEAHQRIIMERLYGQAGDDDLQPPMDTTGTPTPRQPEPSTPSDGGLLSWP